MLPNRLIRSVTEEAEYSDRIEYNQRVDRVPDPDSFLLLDKNLINSGDYDVSYQAEDRSYGWQLDLDTERLIAHKIEFQTNHKEPST